MKNSFLYLFAIMSILLACSSQQQRTDYDIELASIERNIAITEEQLAQMRQEGAGNIRNELIYRHINFLYQRATLTGDYNHYRHVELALEDAFSLLGDTQTLYLFRMYFNFKLHRLKQVERDFEKLASLSEGMEMRALQADLDFQQGHYVQARLAYEDFVEDFQSWDGLARLAYYELKTGRPDKADALYVQAREKMNAKEMRAYAWLELQRGLIDLEYGRYSEALIHYRQANSEYSGYWLIEEHMAEALALTGRTDEAIALYKEISRKTSHPEFLAALAELMENDEPEEASLLLKQVDVLYARQWALYSEAVTGHMIEYLLLHDASSKRLLEYAQENARLRPNSESRLLLLKVFMKLRRTQEARQLLAEILKTPWRTPEVAEWMDVLGCTESLGCV